MLVQPLVSSGYLGEAIAKAVVNLQYAQNPELEKRFGPEGRVKCYQDACFHVAYLLEAADQERPDVFVSYTSWTKGLLKGMGITVEHLAAHLRILREVTDEMLSGERHAHARIAIDQALAKLPDLSNGSDSYLLDSNPLLDLAQRYLSALLERRRDEAVQMILAAVENTTSIREIYLHVFQPVQREIGRLWQLGHINVAQEHYGTAVTQLAMSQLYAYVFASKRTGKTFVASCVGDELHEIGMRMVADFVEMEGWDTIYLGANLPTNNIISAVVDNKADVLGLSATIPFHVGYVRDIVAAVRSTPGADSTRVIVGGYAFGEGGSDWRKTGADAYAVDAVGAVVALAAETK
ncbi:B12-binding domain-containing protein [Magnetospira thiophila]